MTAIDLAALLAPTSAAPPCGPPIEYDEQYLELERLARGVTQEEDAEGKVVREAEEPDWHEVERVALDLCAKAKDLRVAIYLGRAELALTGLPGFADVVALIAGYLGQFWASVHPQLDPTDDNDSSIRVNALAALRDHSTIIRELRMAPLAQSRQFGRISYRDYAIAAGLIAAPSVRHGDEQLPDTMRVQAAFDDTALEALVEAQRAVDSSLGNLEAIVAAVEEAAGIGKGPDLAPLETLLREIKGVLDRELSKRGANEAQDLAAGMGAQGGESAGAGPAAGLGSLTSAGVRSREDVLLLLDKICRYYSDHEPSSPVPLILNRTKRLVTMSFFDILKDLTPAGVSEFGVIAGIKEEE